MATFCIAIFDIQLTNLPNQGFHIETPETFLKVGLTVVTIYLLITYVIYFFEDVLNSRTPNYDILRQNFDDKMSALRQIEEQISDHKSKVANLKLRFSAVQDAKNYGGHVGELFSDYDAALLDLGCEASFSLKAKSGARIEGWERAYHETEANAAKRDENLSKDAARLSSLTSEAQLMLKSGSNPYVSQFRKYCWDFLVPISAASVSLLLLHIPKLSAWLHNLIIG